MKTETTSSARTTSSLRTLAPWIGVAILALVVRLILLPYWTDDYRIIVGWLHYIKENGGLFALPTTPSNYPPLYLYLLWLSGAVFSRLGFSEIFQVKFIAIVFDLVGAIYMAKLVALRYPNSRIPFYAYTATLFAPTVVINSAMWSQVDMLYASALVACIYYLFCNKPNHALIAFGIAFSFKPLALFVGPLLLVLFLRQKLSWRSFLWIPAVYMVTVLPMVLLGGRLLELLGMYGPQVMMEKQLQFNAPTIYAWIWSSEADAASYLFGAGRLFCLGLLLSVVYAASTSPARLTHERILLLAVLFAILGPYTLPGMRDRYFYAADVLTIALAFYIPRMYYAPIGMALISLFAGFPFLFHIRPIPMHYLAVPLLVLLMAVAREVGREMNLLSLELPDREINH